MENFLESLWTYIFNIFTYLFSFIWRETEERIEEIFHKLLHSPMSTKARVKSGVRNSIQASPWVLLETQGCWYLAITCCLQWYTAPLSTARRGATKPRHSQMEIWFSQATTLTEWTFRVHESVMSSLWSIFLCMSFSHVSGGYPFRLAVYVPTAPLPTQLPARRPGKAAQDDL